MKKHMTCNMQMSCEVKYSQLCLLVDKVACTGYCMVKKYGNC